MYIDNFYSEKAIISDIISSNISASNINTENLYIDQLFSSNILKLNSENKIEFNFYNTVTKKYQLSSFISRQGFTQISDKKLKSNLLKIDDSLDKILLINGYTYIRVGNDAREAGLLAQEVEKILPEAVTHFENDGVDTMGIKYERLVPLIVEAIKDLNNKIDKLQFNNNLII